jgi:hypothetical protein
MRRDRAPSSFEQDLRHHALVRSTGRHSQPRSRRVMPVVPRSSLADVAWRDAERPRDGDHGRVGWIAAAALDEAHVSRRDVERVRERLLRETTISPTRAHPLAQRHEDIASTPWLFRHAVQLNASSNHLGPRSRVSVSRAASWPDRDPTSGVPWATTCRPECTGACAVRSGMAIAPSGRRCSRRIAVR